MRENENTGDYCRRREDHRVVLMGFFFPGLSSGVTHLSASSWSPKQWFRPFHPASRVIWRSGGNGWRPRDKDYTLHRPSDVMVLTSDCLKDSSHFERRGRERERQVSRHHLRGLSHRYSVSQTDPDTVSNQTLSFSEAAAQWLKAHITVTLHKFCVCVCVAPVLHQLQFPSAPPAGAVDHCRGDFQKTAVSLLSSGLESFGLVLCKKCYIILSI